MLEILNLINYIQRLMRFFRCFDRQDTKSLMKPTYQ